MPLSAKAIDAAKPGDKARKLFDERGLFLLVQPNGAKWWRFKYRIDGREKSLSLGVYPDISLAVARERRDEARRLVAQGVDPSATRQAEKAARNTAVRTTFKAIALEWLEKHAKGKAERHVKTIRERLEGNLYPDLGSLPISEITAPVLLRSLEKITKRDALEVARRTNQIAGQVFRFAIQTGRADRNPAADLRGALPSRKPGNHAATVDPTKLGGLLRAIEGYDGSMVTKAALRLLPLVVVRPGELQHAQWAEFNLDSAMWIIPSWRMKMKKGHQVPLSTQAVEILREIQRLTGDGQYVFPSERTSARPMSNNTLNAALRRMGITKAEQTAHGFRASFRTIGDEVLGFRTDWMEHQLAHVVKDVNGEAYNRTRFVAERAKMMQSWADYLEQLKQADAERQHA